MNSRRHLLAALFAALLPAPAATRSPQRQEIRDSGHRLLGYILTHANGVREARDAQLRLRCLTGTGERFASTLNWRTFGT